MSNEEQVAPQDWRAQIKNRGKEAFQLEEMRRLGFWPPSEGLQAEIEVAESEVARLDKEIAPLRQQLRELEADISKGANVEAAIAEIRARRIERSKAKRLERKIKRLSEKDERATLWKAKRANEPQFLGHGVSQGLRYNGGDAEKLAELKLPLFETPAQLAEAMGIEARILTWLTFHRGAATIDHYTRFQIPKKRGGMRNVSSPKPKLRAAQSFVLQQILKPLPIHEAATAFFAGASVLENAQRHAEKAVVIRIDLKDFFPSIGFKRVKNMFGSLGYNEGIASVLALICTEAPRVELSLDGQKKFVAIGDRVLPQGACTSPAITNVLCRRLDSRLSGIAKTLGFTYSRYADDLIFSSDATDADVKKIIGMARKIVQEERFVVNDEKTHVMRQNSRQSVTGLIVNAGKSPRVSRDGLREFRAFLHKTEKVGVPKMSEELGRDARAYANGMLAWIAMSDAGKAAQIRAKHGWLNSNIF